VVKGACSCSLPAPSASKPAGGPPERAVSKAQAPPAVSASAAKARPLSFPILADPALRSAHGPRYATGRTGLARLIFCRTICYDDVALARDRRPRVFLMDGQLLHVAPMLAVTDRHFRYLARLLSRHAVLWTEMVHADAVTHNAALLHFDRQEHPVVLQLGGSDPSVLAVAAAAGAAHGYDEINLNCGCPSAKVCHKRDESLCFGARLMLEPEHAGECLRRMAEAVDVPVSVKCRLGVDQRAEYEDLREFVEAVTRDSGVRHVVVHARAALLGGLSTQANRRVPPLRHEAVYRLKEEFPGLRVTLNGGVDSLQAAKEHLAAGVDGVMMGRALQKNPLLLSTVDQLFYGEPAGAARPLAQVFQCYGRYVDAQAAAAGEAHAARTRAKAERHLGIAAVAKARQRCEWRRQAETSCEGAEEN